MTVGGAERDRAHEGGVLLRGVEGHRWEDVGAQGFTPSPSVVPGEEGVEVQRQVGATLLRRPHAEDRGIGRRFGEFLGRVYN